MAVVANSRRAVRLMPKKATTLSPYLDAPAPPPIVSALQALHHGRADEHQQKRALDWILQRACRVFSTTFVAGDPHASAFMQGRAQVGHIIINATRTSAEAAAALEDLNQKDNENG